jgi:hypothetical protein
VRLPTPQWICVNPCNLWENCFGCVGSTILQNRQAEDVLPQISQILTDGACLEFCEFCVLWEYSSPTDCTDQHRWLGALVAAWVRQDAIPSYICVNPCNLWETFLCKKLLCIPWVLWEYSSPTDCTDSHRWLVALVVAWVRQDAIPSYICVNPCYLWETLLCKKLLWVPCVLWEYSSPTDCTDQHRWLVALVRPRNPQNSQKFGCVSGCVGTAGCHTLLHLCASVLSVGDPSLQEASVRSVGSVGVPLLAWLVQQRLLHPLRLHQCHLWKSLLNKKFLCVLWVLWEAIP